MSAIDIGIIVFALALAAIGWERGLIGSAMPLAGFIGGVAAGARIGPPCSRVVGVAVRAGRRSGRRDPARRLPRDRAGRRRRGAAGAPGARQLGPPGGFDRGGFPARDAGLRSGVGLRGRCAERARQRHPRPPPGGPALVDPGRAERRLPAVGPAAERVAADQPSPDVRGPQANVGAPERGIVQDPDVERAAASVVRVRGTACGLGVEGSGWIAGARARGDQRARRRRPGRHDVTTTAGGELDVAVLHYEPRNDLAVLGVPGLGDALHPGRRRPPA